MAELFERVSCTKHNTPLIVTIIVIIIIDVKSRSFLLTNITSVNNEIIANKKSTIVNGFTNASNILFNAESGFS